MLVLPICVGGTPKKHQKELFFMRCQAQTHTLKNFFVCLITKEGRKYLKKQSNFFLVVGYCGWSPFPSRTFWEISVSSWKCKFLRWITMNISVCQKYIWRKIAYHHLVKCVDVSLYWNKVQWINECVTLLYSVEFTLSLKVGSTNFKFLAKIEILDMTWYHALSTHYHVRSRTGYKLAHSRHVIGGGY